MVDLGPFSPPLSHKTALAALHGCTVVLHCETCGIKRKPAEAIPLHPTTVLGRILPKLVCACGKRPARVTVETTWAEKYGAEVLVADVTPLTEPQPKAA